MINGKSILPKLKDDVLSGFSVFLLALPLCLGIAMASNFPPSAGLLTAIVGGLIAGLLGGASLSIKGPAAGLIVIVLGAVTQLGQGDLQVGYERTLAVGVIAALLQIVFAALRLAKLADRMPLAVIHGMLAAIGITIISKQAYVLMGLSLAGQSLSGQSPFRLLWDFPRQLVHLNPIIFLIGILSLCIIVFWPYVKKLRFLPASLIILLILIPFSLFLDMHHPHSYSFLGKSYSLGPPFLIPVPSRFFDVICLPDFSQILTALSLKYIMMLSLVGSIESLLTVRAVDSLAPQAAPSDLNKDLRAIGVGNLICSLIGGLPMISEIVRSKANIDYGAQSFMANFFHGLFMLVAVCCLPSLINLIPLSALAALLLFVGIKLAAPREFIHFFRRGWGPFAVFLVTLVLTLMTDILVGVISGGVLHFLIQKGQGKMMRSKELA